METIIKKLAEKIKDSLIHDMNSEQNGNNTALLLLVLNAYNRYQEDERDGVDYIFNIHNGEDLKCCIDGGMTACEIACINEECGRTANSTPYFMFGQNHKNALVIPTFVALKKKLEASLHEIILQMLAAPSVDGYKELYEYCVSDYISVNDLV